MSASSFGTHPTSVGYVANADLSRDPIWDDGVLQQEQVLEVSFSGAALSYGTGVMEGLKATRATDGRVLLFRVGDHAARFVRSAELMLLPPFPVERFIDAVMQLVRGNLAHVPPAPPDAFYVRPLELALEPMLGLRPPSAATVLMYGSPVPPHGDGGDLALEVLDVPRSAPGGAAEAKAIVNYAGALRHKLHAQSRGFDDVLFSDGGEAVQETLGTNVFCLLRSGELVTPVLDGRFLGGITRDSVIQLARHEGLVVQERVLTVREILDDGQEFFCTGTATGVRSVARMLHRGRVCELRGREVASRLADRLAGIKAGELADTFEWVTELQA